jgi:hypothetical protein
MDRVAEMDRLDEVPFEDSKEREGRHSGEIASQARDVGEAQEPMSDRLTERRLAGELVINVQRIEVACQTGELDDVGLRDRSGGAGPRVSYLDIIEHQWFISMVSHSTFLA